MSLTLTLAKILTLWQLTIYVSNEQFPTILLTIMGNFKCVHG